MTVAAFILATAVALGDGSAADCTETIQRRIDAAAAAGGGVVEIAGKGVHTIYTLSLRSNVELRLGEGVVLKGGDDFRKYPEFGASNDCWRADRPVRWNRRATFYTTGATNVAITGKGVIDGNSKSDLFHRRVRGAYVRVSDTEIPGRCLMFAGCRDVRLEGITVRDTCGWSTWFLDCDRVRITGVRIRADRERPNGDGLHFGGCRDVWVEGCDIDSNDDSIIVRSHQEQMLAPKPCERVTVTNCVLRANQFAIRIGWTGDAPVKDCVFTDLECPYSFRGIGLSVPQMYDRAYTRDPPRGNGIPEPDFPTVPFAAENLVFRNIHLSSYRAPLKFYVGAGELVDTMRRLRFENCRFTSQIPPIFKVRARDRVEDVAFRHCTFDIVRPRGMLSPETGSFCDNMRGVVLDDVKWNVTVSENPEWYLYFRQKAVEGYDRVIDPKTRYAVIVKTDRPAKPGAPIRVEGSRLQPRLEETAAERRYVYDTLSNGIAVWKVRVTLVERKDRAAADRWSFEIENGDGAIEVLGFEGPYADPEARACDETAAFPKGAEGLKPLRLGSKSGWYAAGDRPPSPRKEGDDRVSVHRARAVRAGDWLTDSRGRRYRELLRFDHVTGETSAARQYDLGKHQETEP